MGYNPLESLSANAFSDLSGLIYLDLQFLQATELPPDILSPLASLDVLCLTFSPLRALPSLSGLSSLRAALLFGHPYVTESPSFAGSTNLDFLDLGGTRD